MGKNKIMASKETTENQKGVPDSTVSLETLYATMAEEAAGFYNQVITICTAFLGGTLFFFDKMSVGNIKWASWLLFAGWAALTYPLAVLVFVRWQNVEAHRHALEYFKTQDEKEYEQAVSIPKKARKWTTSAIFSMVIGLAFLALFAGVNIHYKFGGVKMANDKTEKSSNREIIEKSLDPSSAIPRPQPGQSGINKDSLDPSAIIAAPTPVKPITTDTGGEAPKPLAPKPAEGDK